ncbi:hypothetical protein NQ318_007018 [Aromia moschata]|uniref:CHK kinase-like domain-containing protein n=1 Tax=Aromia moschata TaxID=1265417 RepID=A0AAV8Y3B1_9CUCU|nr:hypothetical protein NQ318_007018 [Aromia moschata]
MNVEKIENLEEVLRLDQNQTVADCKITRLTGPGENYGSLIMRLEVKVADDKTKSEKDLDLVAKLLPPNELIRKLFNVQTTFRNESSLYSEIVPVLEEFQKQHGLEVVDIFPKYYGSRISLDPDSDKVDDGAVLILENLNPKGYTTGDRRVGFDLDTARFILKNLAYFHAIPLALKLKNPALFEEKVKPHLTDFAFGDDLDTNGFLRDLYNVLEIDERCRPYFKKIEKLFRQTSLKVVHEPFATVLHNDFWVNNMLLKFENGRPVGIKMVDFQVIEYKCPCRDLLFFLFSSVQLEVLEDHLDELIDLEVFEKQLELAAKEAEYFHIVGMLFPIHANPEDVKELNEISFEDIENNKELSAECNMNVEKIENLEEVLRLDQNQTVADCKITRLTAPGENYGSLIMRLEVKVADDKTKSEKDLDLVAKLLPPNELIRKLFKVQTTFRNESSLYSEIVPVLEEFQKQHGLEVVDIFPKYYGSRISLDPYSDKVDDGAVLILENLNPKGTISKIEAQYREMGHVRKVPSKRQAVVDDDTKLNLLLALEENPITPARYTTGDRRVGFDLDTARFILKNLAYFHAIPLALKLKNPALFEKKVKPHLTDYAFAGDLDANGFLRDLYNVLEIDERCRPYFKKIEKLFRQASLKVVHEPFATVLHNDFWVNNMLLKFENGRPVGIKMVDFQVIEYKCPCRDLLFFLFSSVQLEVLEDHLDELIDLYYESFIEKLQEFECDTAPFSREVFEKQLELAAKEAEYFHIVGMLFPIHANPKDVKELNEISFEDFENNKEISAECKAKLLFVTLEFIRRGWLDNEVDK